jgi:glycosyltransferase involved in cell wall biosynthesis
MKIAFDAKRALNNVAGLGQYSRILLNALMRVYPEQDYHLYTPQKNDRLLAELKGDFKLQLPPTWLERKVPFWWRTFGLTPQLLSQHYDVYHGLSNELPLNFHAVKNTRKIVTIHDVIFLKHEQQYTALDRYIYDFKTRYACRHSDAISTISEETRLDLIKYYGVPESKIQVIPPSCDPVYYDPATEEEKQRIRQKYHLPVRYLLNVSSFFSRKNHKAIVEAMDLLQDTCEEHVVFIGGQGNIKAEIEALIRSKKLEHRFHFLSGVANEEMPAIYQQASVFVYPSFFEGFGLPVLEALFSGVPVVTTRGGCFEEVGGSSTCYVQPDKYGELAEAIATILSDKNRQTQMILAGRAHAETMRDTVFAQKTMELYQGR